MTQALSKAHQSLSWSKITWQPENYKANKWPEAYRHCPVDRAASLCCVVAWWRSGWGEPAFQLCTGLLFGLPLAVTSFNRYSRAAEALGRRLLAISVMVSLYFDDSHLTEWASSKGSAQESCAGLNVCIGSKPSGSVWRLMELSWAWILISVLACKMASPDSSSVSASLQEFKI